ncbi:MAG: F0F1 ATP synthase subunit B [Patescibacteria group bacterium]
MTEAVTDPGLLGSLGINGKLFLAQLVNFAIVLFVVWRWAYKPLLKIMDDREKKIKQGLRDAEQSKRALSEADEKKEALLQSARIEAHDLMEETKKNAEHERTNIKIAAQKDLERQLEEARARLRQDKEVMLSSLKKEVAELVVLATEKVTKQAHDPKVQRAIISDAIDGLDETPATSKK